MSQQTCLALLVAFTAGSIPFGWIFARLWGIGDIRQQGSTNIGATNVVRIAGWTPGVLTFIFDFAKGLFPVLYLPAALSSGDWASAIGFATVAGHCWSPFLKFKGGKGVSTTLGFLIAFDVRIGAGAIIVYVLALGLTRVSAMGSLFAMLSAGLLSVLFTPGMIDKLVICSIIAIVLARHSANWEKLLKLTAALVLTAISLATTLQPTAQATLVDFRGKEVSSASSPRRIAALMPALAEMVIDLGSGDRLVGAPEYSSIPERLKPFVQVLGPYPSISIEAVYALRPDLVLASIDGNDAALVTRLEKMGVRVITINTRSLSEIAKSIDIVAEALGKSGVAAVRDFRKTFAERKTQTDANPRRTVFMQIGWEPLISVGKGTFIDELLERAGGANILADANTRYPRPNVEEIVNRDPDVIIICELTKDGKEAEKARAFWTRFPNMKAVKGNKIIVLPGDWIAKPGLNMVRGLQELRRVI